MSIEELKDKLAPWLRVSTWHTAHHLDDRRFHQALKAAFDSLGTDISFEDFKEAMDQLVKEHHPKMQSDYREKCVEDFARKADNVACYFRDNGI